MAETEMRVEPTVTKKKGFIAKGFDLVARCIGILMFSALVSVLMEWIGMVFFYEEMGYEGYEHAVELMNQEIGYLGSTLDGAFTNFNQEAVQTTSDSVTKAVNFLFIDSGLVGILNSARMPGASDGQILAFLKGLIAEYYNYAMAAIHILTMFMIRLSILVLSLPAFLLFGLVGICDGLMQRDLRRWCGGNESGYVYHWAKKFVFPVLVAGWVIYLAIPNSIHPNFIVTPFAVLFGLVLMVLTSKFKKYL